MLILIQYDAATVTRGPRAKRVVTKITQIIKSGIPMHFPTKKQGRRIEGMLHSSFAA